MKAHIKEMLATARALNKLKILVRMQKSQKLYQWKRIWESVFTNSLTLLLAEAEAQKEEAACRGLWGHKGRGGWGHTPPRG